MGGTGKGGLEVGNRGIRIGPLTASAGAEANKTKRGGGGRSFKGIRKRALRIEFGAEGLDPGVSFLSGLGSLAPEPFNP